jgi:hypothetical protein
MPAARSCCDASASGDRIRIVSPFSAEITDGEVIKRDEISVTIAWDNHTWGQFYADSPLIWDTLSKLPSG